MTTFRTALSLVCVVMVSGCGGSTPVKHTSKTNGGAAHTAAPQINTGILVKPTSRPPDVSEQFDYVGGAGPGNCQIDPAVVTKPAIKFFAQPFSGSPAESPDAQRLPGQATFGQAVDICFDGFGQGPVTVEVRAPDASTIAGVLPRLPPTEKSGDGWAAYDWVPELDPSWPLGRYVVSARAGSLQARTAFVLTPPATAGIRVVGPSTDPGHNEVAADSQAKVYLTGFRGTPSLRLVVYKVKQTGYTQTGFFFGSEQIAVPTSGNTFVRLATGHPPPGTTFILVVRAGGDVLSSAFAVTKPFAGSNTLVGPLPRR
jgi:hypothetical protein